jgi:hypothetical protein
MELTAFFFGTRRSEQRFNQTVQSKELRSVPRFARRTMLRLSHFSIDQQP